MITTVAAKLWFAVSGLAVVAMLLYLGFSDAEWFGAFVLGSIAVTAGLLGVLAVALRDGAIAADAAPPAAVRQTGPAPWPALLGVGGAVTVVGLAGRNTLLYVGFAIIAAAFLEWMIQGWAERATGDPAYNQALRHRIMSPFEIPILSALVVGVVMISLSRVLLAVSKTGSTVLAIVIASVILLVASLLVSRPRLSSSVFAGVLAVGAVAMIAAGIAGGVAGERHFEEHHVEGVEHEGGVGNNPEADEGGEDQSDPGADPSGAPTDGQESGDSSTDVTEPGADSNSTPVSAP